MKVEVFIFSLFFTLFSWGDSFASSFVGIAADGDVDFFQIGEVRSIKFEPQKSGDKGYKTIVFGSVLSENSNVSQVSSIFVYPNPVSEYITITGIDENEEVEIRGVDGVVRQTTRGYNMDVRNLPVGNYILIVKNKAVKFIKK